VGRLDAVKGIDQLLARFAATDQPAPLCVVGDGPLGPELRGRYEGDSRIRFLGTCAPEQLGPLYRDALALILPSAGYEIFGLVVAEAFAHGTPAVVSEVCGVGELVVEAGAGAVFGSAPELDRALQQIAADPAEREAMGARGRSFVTGHLNEEAYLDRYEALVARVREGRAPAQRGAR
jgi:glycosyltransferase involved in cell wall biosynthesis